MSRYALPHQTNNQSTKIPATKHRSGLTLIELMVGISLVVVSIAILSGVFRNAYRTYAFETGRGQVQLTNWTAGERIIRQGGIALSVIDNINGYTTNNQTLILRLASVDSSQIIIPTAYDYAIYRRDPLQSTKLQEIIIADAVSSRQSRIRTLIGGVGNLNFSFYDATGNQLTTNYQNSKRITILLTTETLKFGKKISVSHTRYVTLRNK